MAKSTSNDVSANRFAAFLLGKGLAGAGPLLGSSRHSKTDAE